MNNITPGHVRVFQAVRSQLYDNITLSSCTINGEPGAAITPTMDLRFPGEMGGSGGDGGGPTDPREAFEANKEMTSPAPN